MRVNGKEIPVQSEVSLIEFLQGQGYDAKNVAVEKNGHIVPKQDFRAEVLSDMDKLEIVRLVGGG
ncbi:MAG: sulfur carrier protein ThiS [Peptococcaceae bacterium]|nr:sulfur carrier protein ThiS [Peptococcaceae bacterium]